MSGIGSLADHNALVDDWQQLTRAANDAVDDAMKEAQDKAYRLGLERGRQQLVEFSTRLNAAKRADDQHEWSALVAAICKITEKVAPAGVEGSAA